jgi:hypothetical protein
MPGPNERIRNRRSLGTGRDSSVGSVGEGGLNGGLPRMPLPDIVGDESGSQRVTVDSDS